jgi:glyoxylase I family protein
MTIGLRFSHVALNCRDIAATERFYVRHFGFRRVRVTPLGEHQLVFIRNGPVLLELMDAEGLGSPASADGPTVPGVARHIAFQTDDVDAVLASLGDEVEVTLGPLDFGDFIPGWRTAWLRDPDGVIVEVSQGYVDDPEVSADTSATRERTQPS